MTRLFSLAGLAAAAAGGYVLGRRNDDVRAAIGRGRSVSVQPTQRTQIELRVTRSASLDTEYDHVAEHEYDERHRIAQELKANPLHERPSRTPRRRRENKDEVELPRPASQPLARERDDIVGPRPY